MLADDSGKDDLTALGELPDDTDIVDIPVIDGRKLTYEQVHERFLLPNRPFIALDVADAWPARRDWITQDGLPAWSYLIDHFGAAQVKAVRCARQEDDVDITDDDPSVPRQTFADIARLWQKGNGLGLYIKDWHLPRERELSASTDGSEEPHEPLFSPPTWAEDDWMHHYYSNNTTDDFSFVYFGTNDTHTSLHRDVYASYSWSANILGRKRWHFVRPSQIKWCRHDCGNESSALHKDPRDVENDHVCVLTVEQPENSVMFVPSNWYHMVENISPFVISINRNWCNSVNIMPMYAAMKAEVKATESALEDVRELIWTRRKDLTTEKERQHEWNSAVQDVLRQNAGWDWATFWSMVSFNLRNPSTAARFRPQARFIRHQVHCILRNFTSDNPHLYSFVHDRNSIGFHRECEEDSRSRKWRRENAVDQLPSNTATKHCKNEQLSPAEKAWLESLGALTATCC